MNEEAPVQVDACDREPCKGALSTYYQALGALEAAVGKVNQIKDQRDENGAVLGGSLVAIGGGLAIAAGTGGLLSFAGLALAVGGLGVGIVATREAFRLRGLLNEAREECATARAAFDTARNGVVQNCPRRCWPEDFSGPTCG